MDEENKEQQDSQSAGEENTEQTQEASQDDLDNLDADALKERLQQERKSRQELDEKNRQLFARAKKAEGFEYQNGEWIKRETEDEKPKRSSKKQELDYGEKAFLKANGIDPAQEDEFELFQKTRDKFREDAKLEDVLNDAGFQKELNDLREEKKSREALEGTQDANRGTGAARNQVDYWVNRGELPPNTPENQQLRRDVVNARAKRDENKKRFTDQPVIHG